MLWLVEAFVFGVGWFRPVGLAIWEGDSHHKGSDEGNVVIIATGREKRERAELSEGGMPLPYVQGVSGIGLAMHMG